MSFLLLLRSKIVWGLIIICSKHQLVTEQQRTARSNSALHKMATMSKQNSVLEYYSDYIIYTFYNIANSMERNEEKKNRS